MSGAKTASNMCNYLVVLGSVHTKKVECKIETFCGVFVIHVEIYLNFAELT